jgi:hypothetical protein
LSLLASILFVILPHNSFGAPIKPTITWVNPVDIGIGTALSDMQLNATASVDGTFSYSPEARTVLARGTWTLSVAFMPTDSLNYTTATASVLITVYSTRITGTVTGPDGTPLSGVAVLAISYSGSGIPLAHTNASGVYTMDTEFAGSYVAWTSNTFGYLDQIYSGFPCVNQISNGTSVPAYCPQTDWTPIPTTLGAATTDINFRLVMGGSVSGTVTGFGGLPLAGAHVDIFTETGRWVDTVTTNASGAYTTTEGMSTGSYLARTDNRLGYLDQIYSGLPLVCPPNPLNKFPFAPPCPIDTGTPIAVTTGVMTPSINFQLSFNFARSKYDFNGDGKSDILWRDAAGNVSIWQLDGYSIADSSTIAGTWTGWAIVDSADFNGDGKSDILWRNTSGEVAIWLMDGTTVSSYRSIGNVEMEWSIAGVEDFDGDGKADILWRDASGEVAIWLMNGTTVSSYRSIGNIWMGWSIIGVGDFNGDGKGDILWRDTGGNVAVWLMNGTTVSFFGVVAKMSVSVAFAGIADFNGDGFADILWRDAEGNVSVWQMNGAFLNFSVPIAKIWSGWTIVGIRDFNGDGRVDILWRDTEGNVAIWLMNGTSVSSWSGMGNVSDRMAQ